MADILIRGLPEATVAELDAAAARAGVSRTEYIRRTLSDEAARVARARNRLSREDWLRFEEMAADLGDADVMRGAWS